MSDHRKAKTRFTGTGGFNTGIEGQKVGLEGDLVDGDGDLGDLARAGTDLAHGNHRLLNDLAGGLGDAPHGFRRLGRIFGAAGTLRHIGCNLV